MENGVCDLTCCFPSSISFLIEGSCTAEGATVFTLSEKQHFVTFSKGFKD